MVCSIPLVSGCSLGTPLQTQIEDCLSLLKAETSPSQFAADTAKKVKQLEALLVEYIIANQKGDAAAGKQVEEEIAKLIQSVGGEATLFKDVQSLISSVEKNPSSWNPDLLAFLQQLSQELKDPSTY